MLIGIMADIHDNVDNLRHAINEFNLRQCGLVLLAGDFVSPLVVPPMRKLCCPVIACFGDNDGNRTGIAGGMKIVGTLGIPPFCHTTRDGLRILLAHQLDDLRDWIDDADVVIFAHTHRPSLTQDRHGRLFINPGEVGGWMFRHPTIAILDSETRTAEIVPLPPMPPSVPVHEL